MVLEACGHRDMERNRRKQEIDEGCPLEIGVLFEKFIRHRFAKAESSRDLDRCLRSCSRSECSSPTRSSCGGTRRPLRQTPMDPRRQERHSLASDTSELASVLSHEMAHVIARHAAIRENQARQAALVSRVATDIFNDPQMGAFIIVLRI